MLTSIVLSSSTTGHCEVVIEPRKIVLEANAEKLVKVKITSHEAGHVEGVIDIEPKLFSVSSADFVANFC